MTQRIAIVGNGVAGLSLAYRLANSAPAPNVVIYGPGDLQGAYAGSTAAPAMVNVLGEVTTRVRTSWAARHMLEIGEQAMRLWPEFVERLNRDLAPLGVPQVNLYGGTYILSRRDVEDERRNLHAICETLAERGHAFEEVNLKKPLRHRVVRQDRFEQGIFVPGEMFLNAGKLVNGLHAALSARSNVTFRLVFVEKVDERRVVRDREGGEESYDAVVLANSFGFNDLTEGLGVTDVPLMIPVYGIGSTMPVTSDEPFTVRTPTFGASCGDYAVHYPGHLYVGASAIANTHRVEVTTHLQRSLDFYDPDLNLNELQLTGGIRAMSQDTYPVLGSLVPGVWAAAGFYKSGITLAPYVSDLLARELLGEERIYGNRFQPSRRTEEEPPSLDDLVETIWGEIAASGTSSGSRASLNNYRWLIKLLVRLRTRKAIRSLDDDVYYNSDIIQACIYDSSLSEKLNRHRPRQAA
ncbi:FAD dependent oxidoreductase [Parvibaculum lavamentivorans DS-1]|uniref:FAD dependent oxidoreductase n=1 Tax=Parvibaculum lavamentivorans (strain DS-1 / DSM 13023 / NCIMB 13966) TaxID=402881 RepID=A7HYX1_PARL1|nr:FAD-binding oxidoreductase [Parvibaculum lavamentivorans]ABS65104.1 FAD dependent oxidoreductase [Parvibaculum lavamentivorans DS-1]